MERFELLVIGFRGRHDDHKTMTSYFVLKRIINFFIFAKETKKSLKRIRFSSDKREAKKNFA